ncbi:hypothetical protein RA280_19700 [Cupriavidus sp. CV2]|uniref:hypothetical protein n=1 Tax=Cupriavidus ulmosensis TaxID=3065913 RepID=UPI00296B4E15|nr:hypothetical protein [Cupriavidus sp. CV2]MDW3683928.1 hypothetical protein [Cupriavidus sp. CV2]
MKGFLCVVGALFALVLVIVSIERSDWMKEERAAEVAQRRADAKPRLVSDGADGCKVYAFKPGERWLYFTSCPQRLTSTTNEWTVTTGAGKTSRTHTESLSIDAGTGGGQ